MQNNPYPYHFFKIVFIAALLISKLWAVL